MNGKSLPKKVMYPARHWRLLLALGAVFVLTGVWVWQTPISAYPALYLLFSAVLFFAGFSEIYIAVTAPESSREAGWVLASGFVDILIGALLLFSPAPSVIILPFVIGFPLLFRSMMATGFSLEIRLTHDKSWKNLLFISVLGILFSFLLLSNPGIAEMNVVFWTGCAFIATGIFRCVLGFRLRQLQIASKRME